MTHKAPIYFHNTLGDTVQEFVPRSDDAVRLYSCGPTVYSHAHIGNMRSYLLSDTIRRVLEYNDYAVEQVINITDVGHLVSDNDTGEDKLEKAASERGERAQDIAVHFTELFFEDLKRLNIETKNTRFPRATEYINEQIAMVKTLMETGKAYRIDDGIYYDTALFPTYGQLGNISLEQQEAGARVAENPQKHNPHDFALWKFSQEGETRQQEWDSPWGKGFPGWHIECSAMSRALLGRQLDIHTGGADHIAVHHNNEIAQSEAVSKKRFVNYWLHNAFITIEGRRMGKSLGNLITLDQLLDRHYSPLSYRYWLLTAHYRTPANFTWEALDGSHTALKKLHKYFVDELSVAEGTVSQAYEQKFRSYVNNDLNTPQAIALMWELIKDTTISPEDKRATLLQFDRVLGLGLRESDSSLTALLRGTAQKVTISDIPQEIQNLLAAREEAREAKDYTQADVYRAQIEESGYHIVDTDSGPQLRRSE